MSELEHYDNPQLYSGQKVDCSPVISGERTLKDGSKADEYAKPMPISVHSRCPGKWLLVDLETGESWRPEGLALKSADEASRLLAVDLLGSK